VEILTRKEAEPGRDWLNPHVGYVKTRHARTKIRQWFRKQRREEAIVSGREQLERELARLGHATAAVDFAALAREHDFADEDELFAAIGHGDLGAHRLAITFDAKVHADAPVVLPGPSARPAIGAAAGGVTIDGIGVLSRPARCCNPVPGDPVIGYIGRGSGVSVHRRTCPNVVHAAEPERLVEVDWGADRTRRYTVPIEIRVADERGALRDVTEIISSAGLDLRSATVRGAEGRESVIAAEIAISSSDDLQRVLARLSNLPVVVSARRVRP
jgi:GTP pyrophosphokinase